MSSMTSIESMRPRLAAELALNLMDTKDILMQFSISADVLRSMLADPGFRQMVRGYKQEWLSASNARERTRLKAMLATEEGLETLWAIFRDNEITPGARIDAYKHLTVLADAIPKKDAPDGGPRFHLTLNLGGDDTTDPVIIESEPDVDGVYEEITEDDITQTRTPELSFGGGYTAEPEEDEESEEWQ